MRIQTGPVSEALAVDALVYYAPQIQECCTDGFYDGQFAMSIGEILIWEATEGLLLIPVVIGVVMLTRWIRRRQVFSERDWLFLFGHPREKVLSLHLWIKVAVLWIA